MPTRRTGTRRSPARTGNSRGGRWLAIKVELIEGRGQQFSPAPGRLFAADTSHSFAELAREIDRGFARWDLGHLHEFRLRDGSRIGIADDEDGGDVLDERRTKLNRLMPGDEFVYVFDLGDDWTHRCQVSKNVIDPLETIGTVPRIPTAFFGWGLIPDQYGRSSGDDADF